MSVTIRKATKNDIDEIVKYVLHARSKMYPMLDNKQVPYDLENLGDVYIKSIHSIFLVAFEEGEIVGTIGLLPYDNRFDDIQFTEKSAEIVKLFVTPSYRKQGIGTQLVNTVSYYARLMNYVILYLHTHPFLEGAADFWIRNGYQIIDSTEYAEMPTIHMKKLVSFIS